MTQINLTGNLVEGQEYSVRTSLGEKCTRMFYAGNLHEGEGDIRDLHKSKEVAFMQEIERFGRRGIKVLFNRTGKLEVQADGSIIVSAGQYSFYPSSTSTEDRISRFKCLKRMIDEYRGKEAEKR
jgi:hypothetical protein